MKQKKRAVMNASIDKTHKNKTNKTNKIDETNKADANQRTEKEKVQKDN